MRKQQIAFDSPNLQSWGSFIPRFTNLHALAIIINRHIKTTKAYPLYINGTLQRKNPETIFWVFCYSKTIALRKTALL